MHADFSGCGSARYISQSRAAGDFTAAVLPKDTSYRYSKCIGGMYSWASIRIHWSDFEVPQSRYLLTELMFHNKP